MSDLECTVCASGVPATPGQAALPVAELEAAAAAIRTVQNANDDEPERFEANLLAKVALTAAHRVRAAAQEPHAAPELAAAMRETRLMREGITALRADLEREAAIIHPSKVSQVKRDVSDRLAKILQGK